MAKFNQLGQWTLDGTEDHLLVKTAEQRSAKDSDPKELKKGSDIVSEQFANMDIQVATNKHGQKLQATDEELFGHLVVSEEELQKRDAEWENLIGDSFRGARQPVDDKFKDDKLDFKWEDGKSFNDYLSEKEKEERGKVVS